MPKFFSPKLVKKFLFSSQLEKEKAKIFARHKENLPPSTSTKIIMYKLKNHTPTLKIHIVLNVDIDMQLKDEKLKWERD